MARPASRLSATGSRLSAKLSTANLRALEISSSARRRVFCTSALARRYWSASSAFLACSAASSAWSRLSSSASLAACAASRSSGQGGVGRQDTDGVEGGFDSVVVGHIGWLSSDMAVTRVRTTLRSSLGSRAPFQGQANGSAEEKCSRRASGAVGPTGRRPGMTLRWPKMPSCGSSEPILTAGAQLPVRTRPRGRPGREVPLAAPIAAATRRAITLNGTGSAGHVQPIRPLEKRAALLE